MHVVIHIGPYKTGSTAIQTALRASAAPLAAQGCYYFDTPEMPEFALQTLGLTAPEQMVPDLRHRFGDLAAARAWSARCWQHLEAEVAARRPALTVISSEHFSGLQDPAPLIERLRRSFSRLTVLAYLRDPASLYLSTLQQRIRGNGTRLADLDSPLSYAYPLRRQLQPFLDLVGPGNLQLRRFDPPPPASAPASAPLDAPSRPDTDQAAAPRWDVVADFAAALPALTSDQVPALPALLQAGASRANPSLPGALIAWLACQNAALEAQGPGAGRHQLLARLMQLPSVQALPRLRFADAAQPALIAARARPICAWANETLLPATARLPLPPSAPTPPDLAPHDLAPHNLAQPDPANLAAAQRDLRDWLLAQLTPEATQVLARAMLELPPPPATYRPADAPCPLSLYLPHHLCPLRLDPADEPAQPLPGGLHPR